MKRIISLLLILAAGLVWAQTNQPAQTIQAVQTNQPPEKKLTQQVEISSDHGFFDGIKRQMVYQGNVLVTDAGSTLRCGLLTVDLPPQGGRPTNIVAETNIVIDALDDNGRTNHITANKAVYTYSVVNAVTNEIITFTGGNPTPRLENSQMIATGDPIVLNLSTKQFTGSNYHTIFKQTPGTKGTNASPFEILK